MNGRNVPIASTWSAWQRYGKAMRASAHANIQYATRMAAYQIFATVAMDSAAAGRIMTANVGG